MRRLALIAALVLTAPTAALGSLSAAPKPLQLAYLSSS